MSEITWNKQGYNLLMFVKIRIYLKCNHRIFLDVTTLSNSYRLYLSDLLGSIIATGIYDNWDDENQ